METVPPFSSVCRPEGHVDMTASASAAQHAAVAEILLRDPGVDALITLDLPTRFLTDTEVAGALAEAWSRVGGPDPGDGTAPPPFFLPVIMHGRWSGEGRAILERAGIPALGSPDRAVNALAAVARYAGIRAAAAGGGPCGPRGRLGERSGRAPAGASDR